MACTMYVRLICFQIYLVTTGETQDVNATLMMMMTTTTAPGDKENTPLRKGEDGPSTVSPHREEEELHHDGKELQLETEHH